MCGVIAGCLQYFFLAAFLWMLLEGVHIVLMLVQVFDASRSRLPYYYAAAYGERVPLMSLVLMAVLSVVLMTVVSVVLMAVLSVVLTTVVSVVLMTVLSVVLTTVMSVVLMTVMLAVLTTVMSVVLMTVY